MRFSFRHVIIACVVATAFVAFADGHGLGIVAPAHAEDAHKGHTHSAPREPLKDVSAAEIAQPGALSEIVLGPANAPVTIIEYASITCGHCGRFHRDVLPDLKRKYIDTGVARLIFREFPLEKIAAASAMLVRCAAPERAYSMVEVLFERQQQWLANGDVRAALGAIALEFGIDDAAFEACLADDALFKKIAEVRRRGHREYGVLSTPTFFINGKPLVGPTSLDEFDTIIAPLLKK